MLPVLPLTPFTIPVVNQSNEVDHDTQINHIIGGIRDLQVKHQVDDANQVSQFGQAQGGRRDSNKVAFSQNVDSHEVR